MTDMRKLFERQAAWHKGRLALTWPEKIRMAEAVRESVARFVRVRPAPTTAKILSGRSPRLPR
jgi:hypothetical protein